MHSKCLSVRDRSSVSWPAWRTSALANAADRPTSPASVPAWARRAFLEEVGKPEARINMAKACLLISLEEEAAFQDSVGDHTSSEQWLELLDSADGERAAFALSNRCAVACTCSHSCCDPFTSPTLACLQPQDWAWLDCTGQFSAWEYIGMQWREWPPQAANRENSLFHPRSSSLVWETEPVGPGVYRASWAHILLY